MKCPEGFRWSCVSSFAWWCQVFCCLNIVTGIFVRSQVSLYVVDLAETHHEMPTTEHAPVSKTKILMRTLLSLFGSLRFIVSPWLYSRRPVKWCIKMIQTDVEFIKPQACWRQPNLSYFHGTISVGSVLWKPPRVSVITVPWVPNQCEVMCSEGRPNTWFTNGISWYVASELELEQNAWIHLEKRRQERKMAPPVKDRWPHLDIWTWFEILTIRQLNYILTSATRKEYRRSRLTGLPEPRRRRNGAECGSSW